MQVSVIVSNVNKVLVKDRVSYTLQKPTRDNDYVNEIQLRMQSQTRGRRKLYVETALDPEAIEDVRSRRGV